MKVKFKDKTILPGILISCFLIGATISIYTNQISILYFSVLIWLWGMLSIIEAYEEPSDKG